MAKKSKRKEPPHQQTEQHNRRRKRQKMSSQPEKVMHDFTGLKAWIAYHEDYQATTKLPANLTPNQIKVVAEYRPPAQTPSKDPEIGIYDWISKLQEHVHGSQDVPIVVRYEDKQGLDGPTTWLVTCHVTQAEDPRHLQFPNEKVGYVLLTHTDTPGHPAFPRKKDAKQYAAKCCIEWLVFVGRMSLDDLPQEATSYVRQLDSSSLQSKPPKPSITTQQDASGKSGSSISPEPDNSHKTATERVNDLCRLLQIPPPKYPVFETKGSPDTWSCRPKFLVKDLFPEDIGAVDSVYPKKAARQKSAEIVEKFLTQMIAKRNKEAVCAEESSQLGSRLRD